MASAIESNQIDRCLYKTEEVQLFSIPPPLKSDNYQHNISRWNLDTPLWEGILEIHEIEVLDDDYDDNPFGNDIQETAKNPKDFFKLELRLLNDIDYSLFAVVPRISVLNGELNITPTDSSKIYVVFAETTEDFEIEISSINEGDGKGSGNSHNFIKRIALGMRLPSSYEASNFNLYLREFERNYKIFEEAFEDHQKEIEMEKEKEKEKDTPMESVSHDGEKKVEELADRFYEISVGDKSRLESESDDDSDDFGEFEEA